MNAYTADSAYEDTPDYQDMVDYDEPCDRCGLLSQECQCPPMEQCPECGGGWRLVVADHSGPGFCAGTVYCFDLECGHQIVDDQSYLEP